MKNKISTYQFINTIESNDSNIFSEIISVKTVKQSYILFLHKLSISDIPEDAELFKRLSKYSPTKVDKFITKLTVCMTPQSYEVTAKKELYRKDHSFVNRIYADQMWRLNADPIAKIITEYRGLLFHKIPDSKYLSQKHIKKLNSKSIKAYPYAYSCSSTAVGLFCNISSGFKIDSEGVSKISNFTELFANVFNTKNLTFKKLSSKKTQEFIENTPSDNYFKIDKSKYALILQYAALNVMCGRNHSEVTSAQTIKKNVLFEGSDGYIYINNLSKAELAYLKDNNKYIPLDEYGRRYTVLNSIKKTVRNMMFSGRFEYDIDSSALMTLINIVFGNYQKETDENVIQRLKRTYPAIYELVSSKKITRYTVAEAFGCSVEEAKKLITTLLFDPFNRIKYRFRRKREKQVKFAIQLIRELRHLSKTVEFIIFEAAEEQVNMHYKFNGIKIKDIRTIVAEDIRISKFKNPKKFGRGKKYFGKKLFRFYAIIENGIRTVMMEYAEKIGSHYNQLHDCIFIDKKIETKNLTDYVRYKTGFIYLFSEHKI